ncbi:MAG: SMC-Scp complex subunit ScpB [Bacteroidia bacterium]|nr:SMC-Scp complex subunit ScpB [Bacteroidia bacterium]
MKSLAHHIEALIFTAEQGISIQEIQACLKTAYDWDLSSEEITAEIEILKEKYASDEFSFEIREIAEGFEFLTKKEFHAPVSTLLQIKEKKKLTNSALETLAIIAYKQPVSKTEIEQIRGVNCDYSIQKLLEKELIVIKGKSDGPGRPLLYGTSEQFMDHFGLKSVRDLPKLKDLHIEANEIGIPSEQLEAVTEELVPPTVPEQQQEENN